MILSPDLIRQRLKKLGIKPDKHLGQHFLIDQAVLDTMIGAARDIIQPDDTIVEVGPGLGVLTRELIMLQNQIVAIERDPVFAGYLADWLGQPKNLTVIQGNVLDELRPPRALALKDWCVVANIPYAITSPLIRGLLNLESPPHHILVLVQKESAERLTALPRDPARGLLTVEVEIKAEATLIETVPKEAFWPQPEVESAILLLTLRPTSLVTPSEMAAVLKIATAGFSAKRKQLRNSLSGALRLEPANVDSALKEAGIAPERRAETLTIEEWLRLTQRLRN